MKNKEKIFKRSIDYFISIMSQRAINAIIHLIRHPVFIFYLGAGVYGDWLLLLSIPSFLSLYEFGFATAGINKISMSYAEKKYQECMKTFLTVLMLLITFGGMLIIVSYFLLYNFNFLDNYFDYLNEQNINNYIFILILYLVVGNISGYFNTLLHTINLYASSVYYKNIFLIIEFIVSVTVLIYSNDLFLVLLSMLLIRIIRLIFMIYISFIKIKWLSLKLEFLSLTEVKDIILPSLTFLFPPITFIMKNQAILYLIGYYMNSEYITLFVLTLTISRIIYPIGNLMNDAIKIEINQLYIVNDFEKMLKIYFLNIRLIFWVLIVVTLPISIFCTYFFEIWSLGRVMFDSSLFTILIVCSLLATLVGPLQLFLYGTNLHSRYVSVNFILASINFFILILYFQTTGLNFIAFSLLFLEFLTLISVLFFTSKSLDKNLIYFIKNICKFPEIKELFILSLKIFKGKKVFNLFFK
jgi:O-antigen/teichoic acid export membrane protein